MYWLHGSSLHRRTHLPRSSSRRRRSSDHCNPVCHPGLYLRPRFRSRRSPPRPCSGRMDTCRYSQAYRRRPSPQPIPRTDPGSRAQDKLCHVTGQAVRVRDRFDHTRPDTTDPQISRAKPVTGLQFLSSLSDECVHTALIWAEPRLRWPHSPIPPLGPPSTVAITRIREASLLTSVF